MADRPPPYLPSRHYTRVFTPAQCDRVVALGDGLLEGRGDLHGGAEADAVRDAAVGWITRTDATEWIFERVRHVVDRANRHYRLDLDGFEEDLQYTSYDRAGAHYDWHQDGLDGAVGRRKLSMVVQLSDPAAYRGGDLELFGEDGAVDDDGVAARRRRGSALVFPAFEFHRVTPIRAGVRRSLVAWIGGPPFR
ncbi:MAG: 2OG-Fe(II) oxygenase [Microthrixaceae bacterium]